LRCICPCSSLFACCPAVKSAPAGLWFAWNLRARSFKVPEAVDYGFPSTQGSSPVSARAYRFPRAGLLLGLKSGKPARLPPGASGRDPHSCSSSTHWFLILTFAFLLLWWTRRFQTVQLYFRSAPTWLSQRFWSHLRGALKAPRSLLPVDHHLLQFDSREQRGKGRRGARAQSCTPESWNAGNLGFCPLLYSRYRLQQGNVSHRAHALGFWAVAFLGAYSTRRLQAIEWNCRQDRFHLSQLQRLNELIVGQHLRTA